MVTDATMFKAAYRPNAASAPITHTLGRQQPWTVWYEGKVCYFCETKEDAEKRSRALTGGYV